jgi:predicted metal-dependent peptidase
MYNKVKLTRDQEEKFAIARTKFMFQSPFYAHLYHSLGVEVFTLDVPTAATDGRHIIINPEYFCGLKVAEQVFVLAHEMSHVVCRHNQRFKFYQTDGTVKHSPTIWPLMNIAADYVINADLVDTKVGQINQGWLFDPTITSDMLWEDVYERLFQPPPPTPTPGPGQGQGGSLGPPSKAGQALSKYGKPDPMAPDGTFDQVFEPPVDPLTGESQLPDENEFKQAVAQAAAEAKAMGKLPGSIERLVNEILDPQIDWRDHVRMLITAHIGTDSECWAKPNRRRLALNPIVIMPGRRGFGADCVAVGIDTSGSIGEDELNAFFAEVGGVLNDCRPQRIIVIPCDHRVGKVEEVHTLDEFDAMRAKGVIGGGGTDLRLIFRYLADENITPDTTIILTDGHTPFDTHAPAHPVVWCMTTDVQAPWGERVQITI